MHAGNSSGQDFACGPTVASLVQHYHLTGTLTSNTSQELGFEAGSTMLVPQTEYFCPELARHSSEALPDVHDVGKAIQRA